MSKGQSVHIPEVGYGTIIESLISLDTYLISSGDRIFWCRGSELEPAGSEVIKCSLFC